MRLKLLYILPIITATSIAKAAATDPIEFTHCYDFGCNSTQQLSFSERQWFFIEQMFPAPALSPWLEKQQIRRAIALMEAFAGSMIGTNADLGGNYSGYGLSFQQDCIDESSNTTQYLQALQQRGLLKWHQVEPRVRRIVWLATHWTAVIKERHSDKKFAVDSWYLDNGEPPYIQPLADWQRKKSFPDDLNP